MPHCPRSRGAACLPGVQRCLCCRAAGALGKMLPSFCWGARVAWHCRGSAVDPDLETHFSSLLGGQHCPRRKLASTHAEWGQEARKASAGLLFSQVFWWCYSTDDSPSPVTQHDRILTHQDWGMQPLWKPGGCFEAAVLQGVTVVSSGDLAAFR